MAVIPHGQTLRAVRQDSIHSGEDVSAELAERIQAQYPVPPFNLGPDASIGVSRNYGRTYVGIGDTAHTLVNALGEDVSGMSAVKLDVTTTAPGGGMQVLPNPRAQVNPSAFNSTFRLKTWQDGRQQLQYIQSLLFRFTASFSDGCREEPPKDPGSIEGGVVGHQVGTVDPNCPGIPTTSSGLGPSRTSTHPPMTGASPPYCWELRSKRELREQSP